MNMGDHITIREFEWTESNGLDVSGGPFAVDSDSSSQNSDAKETPFTRHGPMIEADPDSVDMQRDFWSHFAIGFILDYRKFLVPYLQQVINTAWRIRGEVSVVGRDYIFYLIRFELEEYLDHMCAEGPWAMDGAFLVLEK